MEDIKQIGLNIWGLKGGKSCFCHSENLDVTSPEIVSTWLDIREFVYVSDLTVRFYALEFTTNYKVFTIYRPVNDVQRTGGYYAVTLYVPHSHKINRILDLMRQISDAYYRDHYDAFGNPNNNPDYAQVYLELIKNYAGNYVRETEVRSWESSEQNSTPRIMPFTTIATVEQFFDKPYRREFLKSQEVMFWDVDCLQNQQSHGVKFQKPEMLSMLFDTDGKNIAPQYEGGVIRNAPEGCTIERFEREGVDITQNWQSCFFYDRTRVAIVLKKPFHQPLNYQGPVIGVGSPFVKRGDDYGFNSRLDFRPRHYEVPINVANVGNTPIDLYFDGQRVGISGGRGTFGFEGNRANGTCKVTIKPDGMTEFKVGDLLMSKFFMTGSDDSDRLQACVIDNLKVFRFLFNQDCKGRLNLRWSQSSINFSTVNKVYEIVLTSEKNASDFFLEVDGYKAEVKSADNTTFEVTLTKQNFIVEIAVPEALKRYVYPESLVLTVGGKTYKGYRAILPMEEKGSDFKLGIDVDNKGHVMDCEFDKRPNGDDMTLVPQLALIQNSSDKPLRLMAPNNTIEVFANSTVVVPAKYEPKLLNDADKYEVKTQRDGDGTKRTIFSLKAVAASASTIGVSNTNAEKYGNTGGSNTTSVSQGSGNHGNSQDGKKTNRVLIGSYWYAGHEFKLYPDNCTRNGDGSYSVIIGGMTCYLCFEGRRPVASKQKNYEDVNKTNGFKVTVDGERCIVNTITPKPSGRKGPSKGGETKGTTGGKRRWFLLGGIGLGALLLIGGIVWLVLALSKSERILKIENVPYYTFDVSFIPEGKGHKMDSIEKYYYHLDKKCTQVVVHVKGQVSFFDTITIDKNMFTKEKNYTYTVNDIKTKVDEMIQKKRIEEENLLKNNKDKILSDFEKYLRKVWSMECSLKMLDSLAICNNSINEYLGLSNSLRNFNSKNPNYDTKKKIVKSVFNMDYTRGDGDDWVGLFIDKQKSFFINLKEKDNDKLFSASKPKWYGIKDRPQYFTAEQQEVINAINTKDPFQYAHDLIKKDTLANYSKIKMVLDTIKK